jgi:hypothetical protein
MDVSIDAPVGENVGDIARPDNIMNYFRDQLSVGNLLMAIDEKRGGKKEAWVAPPISTDVGKCSPDLVQAIVDFQTFWKARGDLHLIDGVVDPSGHTLALMNDLRDLLDKGFTLSPPEGQLDSTACWAASLSWITRSNLYYPTVSQLRLLAFGSSVWDSDGTISPTGFETIIRISGIPLTSQRQTAGQLESMIRRHRLPMAVAFQRLLGGHMNVIHGFNESQNTVFAMEPWYPPAEDDPGYVEVDEELGPPVFESIADGSPFKFRGAHIWRPITYYTTNPLKKWGIFATAVF